jgi:sugar lactone lactonase YvrE
MYWTDWGTKPMIVRGHMSGVNRTDMITTTLRWPNGITIDFTAKKLYWTDAGLDRIERANLDGSQREVLNPLTTEPAKTGGR